VGPGRWIGNWEPEDPVFWEDTGKAIAGKQTWLSILSEHLGFSVWVLWTIVVINLGNIGIKLSVPELFWLTAVPNLVGSFLRLPYTFARSPLRRPAVDDHEHHPAARPHHAAGRWSSPAVAGPTRATACSCGCCLVCAATAGLGGGNFSSSMFNISFFFPSGEGPGARAQRRRGHLGVAVAQLLVPLALIVGVPRRR